MARSPEPLASHHVRWDWSSAPLGDPCLTVELRGLPAVPGQDRSVWAVRLSEGLELALAWRRNAPGKSVAAPHAEVCCRPDIEAAQPEHHEDLGCPRSHPANRPQPPFDFIVALMREDAPGERDRAVEDLGGEVA